MRESTRLDHGQERHFPPRRAKKRQGAPGTRTGASNHMRNNRISVGKRCAPEGQRSQETTVFEGFFPPLLSRGSLRRAHSKRHMEMLFHIILHAALILTHLSISWLLSLGRSSWKIQNPNFSRGNGGNLTAGSQRALDQGQRGASQESYHIDARHGLTLSISTVGRACEDGCVPSTINRCLDFM